MGKKILFFMLFIYATTFSYSMEDGFTIRDEYATQILAGLKFSSPTKEVNIFFDNQKEVYTLTCPFESCCNYKKYFSKDRTSVLIRNYQRHHDVKNFICHEKDGTQTIINK